jgi:predicted acyl esterase
LPTPSTREIHLELDQRVPMRDGITLSADIYRPMDSLYTSKKYPVILTRTPYMKLNERMLVPAKYFAELGYVFIAMDVRGRGRMEMLAL